MALAEGVLDDLCEDNARMEGINTAPAFRDAFMSKRCLIPADGISP
ncbi:MULTISPECIES: SOS response-associated peptidase family protein [unclassified Mesorhizobium]|nr:hypothetical protein X768_14110 [Mesorhizobium sp. LSJC265A00]ESX51792.1 hypothetical protein X760_31055 [Mesorhizobium sp. LSHC422A00]ESX82548.1 hypothetical protein X755_33065 [Mesorhizobium sp. LNJC405B00]ESX84977.1 hypothetical protein X754_29445 [Mesorhizobium sp. LNJC403B00]ESY00865.1 hypothetical protein X753_28540 [Mesorhizobium sp. LNJC399B00]ESY12590.1 hypothetical protein X750_31560 [Mesorhizobium sp. LNJC394B00]ESY28638.1 hypothetical protein X747_32420 [Mesorhizobium sp. LNJC3